MLASVTSDTSNMGKAVSVVDDVLENLVAAGLAWRMRLPPRHVGVHPCNRGGYGVSAIHVHDLGRDVVEMGWSPSATAHAVCIEDNAAGDIATFNVRMSSASAGLGKVPGQEIKYGSLSCSHTNQFLVAVLCAVETEEEALVVDIAVDKRMSASKLSSDAKLKDALEHGLTWLVISSTVDKLYPGFADIVQDTRNRTGAAQRNETEMQVLLRIQSMATASSKANSGAVNWAEIKNIIMLRKGLSEADFMPLLKYVQIYGGGDDGKFLHEFNAFHKEFVPAGRIIPTATFSAMMDLKLAPHELCPFFMSATLKAQSTCPKTKAPNKICRYLSSSDISSLQGAKKEAMLEAEKFLRQCREIVKLSGAEPSSYSKSLGRLDCMVARFVFKKDDKYASLEQIGEQFMSELNAAITQQNPSACPLVSPWRSSASATASAAPHPNIVQYDPKGQAVAAAKLSLQSAGWR